MGKVAICAGSFNFTNSPELGRIVWGRSGETALSGRGFLLEAPHIKVCSRLSRLRLCVLFRRGFGHQGLELLKSRSLRKRRLTLGSRPPASPESSSSAYDGASAILRSFSLLSGGTFAPSRGTISAASNDFKTTSTLVARGASRRPHLLREGPP